MYFASTTLSHSCSRRRPASGISIDQDHFLERLEAVPADGSSKRIYLDRPRLGAAVEAETQDGINGIVAETDVRSPLRLGCRRSPPSRACAPGATWQPCVGWSRVSRLLSSSVQTASNVREQLARERWGPSRTGGPSSRRCCPYCSSRAGTNWSSGPHRRRRIRVRPGGGPGLILSYLGWPRRSSAGTATITATATGVAVAVVAREAERGGLHRTALPPGRPRGRPLPEASRIAPPPPPQLPLLPLIRLRLRIPHRRPSRDHYPEPE